VCQVHSQNARRCRSCRAAWLAASTRIVALTGAGISTESGIPDFRGPQGVWTKNPTAEKLSNIHYYMSDPEIRRLAWKARIDHPGWHATSNAGHHALTALEQRGQLHALITQNIDGLHQSRRRSTMRPMPCSMSRLAKSYRHFAASLPDIFTTDMSLNSRSDAPRDR